MTAPMKKITWCGIYLICKSKLHIVQLQVIQKYMDVASICYLREVSQITFAFFGIFLTMYVP